MTLPYKPRQALPFAPGAAPDESGPSVAHDAQDASQVAIPQPRRMSRKCVICGTEKRPEWAESELFYKSVTPAGVALLRGPAFAGVEGGWK